MYLGEYTVVNSNFVIRFFFHSVSFYAFECQTKCMPFIFSLKADSVIAFNIIPCIRPDFSTLEIVIHIWDSLVLWHFFFAHIFTQPNPTYIFHKMNKLQRHLAIFECKLLGTCKHFLYCVEFFVYCTFYSLSFIIRKISKWIKKR